MDLKLIRIPIGNSDQDKENFVEKLTEVYPQNSEEKLGNVWSEYTTRGILQILLDIETAVIVATMSAMPGGTYWQLSADFLHDVPHIDKFLEDPSTVYNVKNSKVNPKYSNKMESKTDFDMDEILDEIAENTTNDKNGNVVVNGYDILSQNKKDFLKTYSEKK